MTDRAKTAWTFAITAIALFIVSLVNPLVTPALPVIKRRLGAALSGAAWSRNAHTRVSTVLLMGGPRRNLDLRGLSLDSAGLCGIVFRLVRAHSHGWGSVGVAGSLAVGAALVAAFVVWELRAREPMLPMRFFRSREFTAANATSL